MNEKKVLNVGDEVDVEYFVGEKNKGMITRRFHIYGSKPTQFFYEVFIPLVEEYIYIL